MKRTLQINLLVTASLLAPVTGCTLKQGTAVGQSATDDTAEDGFSPNQTYPANAYFPNLGYYHPAAHWFYPYPVNYHNPLLGYYFNGSWGPSAQPVPLATQPDASRAFAYLAQHRRRHGFAAFFHSTGSRGGEAGAHGISRGGFGGAGHASGGT